MTTIGFIVTLIALMLGGKPHKNGCSYIVEIGKNWGGVSLGAFALCGSYSETSPTWFNETRKHEFGHSIQNLFLGPLFIFIVAIPSACRYWYMTIGESKGKIFPNNWYYKAWFEHTASSWGTKLVGFLEN